MTNIIKIPFTEEQVKCLNDNQRSGQFHPFTCGACRDEKGCWEGNDRVDRTLVATPTGWQCHWCHYTQDWAYDFMIETLPKTSMRKSLDQYAKELMEFREYRTSINAMPKVDQTE